MSIRRCKRLLDCNSKENLIALASRLNSLCDKLNEQFSINWGGCCYTAYCIAALLEQDGFNYSLVIFDEEYELTNVNGLNDLPAVDHCAIVLENDEGVKLNINCSLSDYVCHYTRLKINSEDLLDYYIRTRWNSSYDKTNNLLVRSIIEEVYYEFTKSLRQG